MTGKVIPFPGCEPQQPECSCPEGSANPGCEVHPAQPEIPPFLDWVYAEVVDFCQWAEDLVEVAEGGEEQFWRRVVMLRERINGWSPP